MPLHRVSNHFITPFCGEEWDVVRYGHPVPTYSILFCHIISHYAILSRHDVQCREVVLRFVQPSRPISLRDAT
jgi:hypothetical protein